VAAGTTPPERAARTSHTSPTLHTCHHAPEVPVGPGQRPALRLAGGAVGADVHAHLRQQPPLPMRGGGTGTGALQRPAGPAECRPAGANAACIKWLQLQSPVGF
jgi:hypothetical protein